jgi:alpha-galactosidase
MPSKKIVCLGAGSGYFTRALGDLAITEGLAGSELTLYDIDMEKSELMAAHGRRLAELSSTGLRVRACSTLADALDGADYAISSIGGAGESLGRVYDTGYHVSDVRIPAKYGVYQVVGDTGGPAALMMGLRSIPIYLDICAEMEKRCPDVLLFNHSNPMAPLCRAINKYSDIQVVGICHGVQIGIMHVAEVLGLAPEELEAVWIGTNHYYWFTRLRHRGKDIYPQVRQAMAALDSPKGSLMTQKLSQIYDYQIVYPEDDHIIEFYPYLSQLPDGDSLPYGLKSWLGEGGYSGTSEHQHVEPSGAEKVAQRQAMLSEYEAHLATVELPKPTSTVRGEGLGSMLAAIACGQRQVRIVNIPNRGVVPNLPDHAVLEVEGVTDSVGVRGLYAGPAPVSLAGLLQKRIAWQELVADAATKGSRNLALQALLLDEMAIRPEQAELMLDELLASSQPMLPRFA